MKRLNLSLSIAFAVAFAGTALAETNFYLVPEGTPGNTPTSPYASWATAANQLSDITSILPQCKSRSSRSIINVKPGTYYPTNQAFVAGNREYTVFRSCDPETGNTDAANTIFDGSKMPFTNGKQSRILKTDTYNARWEIEGLTFRNMAAGGAIRLGAGSSPVFVNDCHFDHNVASNDYGGAIYSFYNTTHVSNCTFRCNQAVGASAAVGGGALSIRGAGGTVVNCLFATNEVVLASGIEGRGGAVDIGGTGTLRIESCDFRDNLIRGGTGRGGHVNAETSTSIKLTDCTFRGKVGGAYGSVLRVSGSGDTAQMTGCRFEGFSAPYGSGYGHVVTHGGITATLTDCTFSNLTGVAVFCYEAKSTTVRNSLFCQSGATLNAESMWVWAGAATCENCTFTGVRAAHKFQGENGESMAFVNCILPNRTNCANDKTTLENCGVLNECAAFPFLSVAKNDYRLNAEATAFIDAGKALDWHAGAMDLGGRSRVAGTAVDIGCFERQTDDPTEIYYYRAVATEAEKTGAWADAYVGIQAAIDAAPSGSYVGIRSGVWNIAKTITVYGKSLTIRSLKADADEIDRDGTILDGGHARRIMQVTNMSEPLFFNSDKPSGLESLAGKVVIEGLTFRNGDATQGTTTEEGVTRDADGYRVDNNGGGLYLYGRAANYSLARNCRFVNNTAQNGGGMYLDWGGAAEDCLFETNSATAGCGGGLCGYDQNAKAVSDPWSVAGKTDPLALRCRFIGNQSTKTGGGFGDGAGWCYWRVFAFDCYFDSNKSTENGGGNFSGGAGSWVAGCTFRNGRCKHEYTAANIMMRNSAVISNCVIYGGRDLEGDATHNVSIGSSDSSSRTLAGTCQIVDSVISNASWGILVDAALLVRNSLLANMTQLRLNYIPDSGAAAGWTRFENCTLSSLRIDGYTDASRALRVTATNTIFDCSFAGFGQYDETHFTTLTAGNCCFATLPSGTAFDIDPTTCFAESPRFMGGGDYTLRRTSRCRDAGVLQSWMPAHVDLAGHARVITNGRTLAENPNALPDIGCFEYPWQNRGFMLMAR